jgi:hypothetical protein
MFPHRASSSIGPVRVVLATTTLLAFISSWRAAALALVEFGGIAFFASGAAERALGQMAPWCVLAAVLAGCALRAIDLEGCALFVAGGLYGTVKRAYGKPAARVAASALLVDHLLFGALAAVVAGQYLTLIARTALGLEQINDEVTAGDVSAAMAACLLGLIWWWQRQGRSIFDRILTRVVSGAVAVLALVIATGVVSVVLRGGFHTLLASFRVSQLPIAFLPGLPALPGHCRRR